MKWQIKRSGLSGDVSSQYNNFCQHTSNQAARYYSRREAFETENFVWHMRMMDVVISVVRLHNSC